MEYLIFSYYRSDNEVKYDVEFRHSTGGKRGAEVSSFVGMGTDLILGPEVSSGYPTMCKFTVGC